MNKKSSLIILITLITSIIALTSVLILFGQKSIFTDEILKTKFGEIQKIEKEKSDLEQKVSKLENELSESNKRNEEFFQFLTDKEAEEIGGEITIVDGEATVIVRILNFRSGPSLSHGINRGLPRGEKLKVLEGREKADGYTWIEVEDKNGKKGWIASIYTKN